MTETPEQDRAIAGTLALTAQAMRKALENAEDDRTRLAEGKTTRGAGYLRYNRHDWQVWREGALAMIDYVETVAIGYANYSATKAGESTESGGPTE